MSSRLKVVAPQRARSVPVCEPLEGRQLLAADLVAVQVTGRLPTNLVTGQRPRIPAIGMIVRNAGNTEVRDDVLVRLYASADGNLDPATDHFIEETTSRLRLKPNRQRRIPLRLRAPLGNIPQGSYQLLAEVDSTNVVAEDQEGNNVVGTSGSVVIAPPFVNLTASRLLVSGRNVAIRGRPVRISLTVLNQGNIHARGTGVVEVTFTPLGQSVVATGTVAVKINVRPGKTGTLRGRFAVPAGIGEGAYAVDARLITTVGFAETNTGDNSATAAPVTVR